MVMAGDGAILLVEIKPGDASVSSDAPILPHIVGFLGGANNLIDVDVDGLGKLERVGEAFGVAVDSSIEQGHVFNYIAILECIQGVGRGGGVADTFKSFDRLR